MFHGTEIPKDLRISLHRFLAYSSTIPLYDGVFLYSGNSVGLAVLL